MYNKVVKVDTKCYRKIIFDGQWNGDAAFYHLINLMAGAVSIYCRPSPEAKVACISPKGQDNKGTGKEHRRSSVQVGSFGHPSKHS
jgi:hypothetical protein